MLRVLTLAILFFLMAGSSAAQHTAHDQPGDAYEVRLSREGSTRRDDEASSSSFRDGGQLIERVIAVEAAGVVLEFDLSRDSTPEDRARQWQWPARILMSGDGSMSLLNATEIEGRIDAWLTAASIPREACGRWLFTWTAFKIECDPQSVLRALDSFNLRTGELSDGAAYAVRGGLAPAFLRLESAEPTGAVFIVETQIDIASLRLERAENDVAVAEIMGPEPLTLEAALERRADEQIEGGLHVTLTTDSRGRVVQRTTVATTLITEADGSKERSTTTTRVERRPL